MDVTTVQLRYSGQRTMSKMGHIFGKPTKVPMSVATNEWVVVMIRRMRHASLQHSGDDKSPTPAVERQARNSPDVFNPGYAIAAVLV